MRGILNGQGGAGFPTGWKEELTAEVVGSAILKNDPVVTCKYGNYDTTIDKISSPSVLPAGRGKGCSWSPDGVYLAIAHWTAPYITVYKRENDVLTKLANPDVAPTGSSEGCSWSPDGVYLAVAHSVTPFLTIYKRTGDTLTKLANPATLPTAAGQACAFSPNGTYLAFGGSAVSNCFAVYKRVGDVFTKLSAPTAGDSPNDVAMGGCSWSPDSNLLAFGIVNTSYETSSHVIIFTRSADVFTKLNTSIAKVERCFTYDVSFSPDGVYFSYVDTRDVETKYGNLFVYKISGTTFTKLTVPELSTTSCVASGCAWSPDGSYLVVTALGIPNKISIFKRTNDTFVKISGPASPPAGYWKCGFSPDGTYLTIVGETSPYLDNYRTTTKDVVQKITSFEATPLSWFPLPRHKIGLAKSDGAIGSTIKINLFPNLNNL